MHNQVVYTLVSGMKQSYSLNPPPIILTDTIQHDSVSYSEPRNSDWNANRLYMILRSHEISCINVMYL